MCWLNMCTKSTWHSRLPTQHARSRHKARRLVRGSFSNREPHDVRFLWDICYEQALATWEDDPGVQYPIVTALCALLTSYEDPQAKEHMQKALDALRWDDSICVITSEQLFLRLLHLTHEVAIKTGHLELER